MPEFLPLPHPSWRTRGWVRKNPWYEADVVPVLRERVKQLVET
jgi:uracil-DNA glycosylase